MNRRQFALGSLATAGPFLSSAAPKELAGKLGIVTASLTKHISSAPQAGKITLLDFPQFMSEELGLEIIDFNTMNFHRYDSAYLDKLRNNVFKFGCTATNLKLNQKVNMASADPDERDEAMRIYKESINAAKTLGCRWVRPLPRSEKPDSILQVAAFDELIDYAGERGITVLVENFGWMMKDPDSIINLVESLGGDRVEVGVDTGNWSDNAVRYPALEKSFPLSTTCDFKAKGLSESFDHSAYDLERCFRIGRDAGFQGPWCLEHGNADFSRAKRELIWMREQLETWIAAA